jgi:uridylate kinase
MRAVVKLGGALFRRTPDTRMISSTAKVLSDFAAQGNQLVAVTGGGENARAYIMAARSLGAEESTCDLIGIDITRVNAEILRIALGPAAALKIPSSLSELRHYTAEGRVVVMGGLQPGQSTNAVAALAAEITRSDILVNGTDVEGVYTADPKKDPNAKLIKSVNISKLLSWAMGGNVYAGSYELLDPMALKILERSKTPTRFVSISNAETILSALKGKDVGTLVVYS